MLTWQINQDLYICDQRLHQWLRVINTKRCSTHCSIARSDDYIPSQEQKTEPDKTLRMMIAFLIPRTRQPSISKGRCTTRCCGRRRGYNVGRFAGFPWCPARANRDGLPVTPIVAREGCEAFIKM